MQASLLLTAFVGLAFALARPAMAQTLGCVGGGTGGAVPTAGTGGGGTFPTELPPYPGVYTLNVPALPPGASVVSEVKVLGITHTAAADLHFVLTSPAGVAHNLLFRHGGSCDFAGDYTLVPGCSGAVVSPWTCSGLLFPGAYEQFFGLWPEGESGLVNASIATIPAATGVWTLSVYDWDSGDIGNVNSWELCFGAPPTTASHAPSGAPTPTLPHDGAVRFGPSIQFGWLPDPCATSYDLEIDGVVVGNAPSASCIHSTSAGVHTWRVRSRNAAGAGPWSVALSFTDLGAPPAPCSGAQLATMLDRDFSSGSGSILFFDVDVLRPSGILVSELDTNTTAAVTAQITLQVYLKAGTHVGATNSPSAWTLVSTGAGVSAGLDQASRVDIADFQIPPGLHALGVRILSGGHGYSLGNGVNQTYANTDLTLSLGQFQSWAFSSTPVSARVWNGRLRYDCIAPPAVYCTPGTTTNGCSASISASATPSASFATACRIDVASVEGQKPGLVFYGVDNAGFAPVPWGGGSTSFLCVRSPLQRAQLVNSGGTASACDGVLSMDWNAFAASHPTALGAPFLVGARLYVQAWFRDPPAPRGANASDAIELTVGP